MRTKLFLLLIFSSLTSLLYSQKLTEEDFQGLWYIINNRTQNFDSLYNLRYDSIIFVHNWRNEITELDVPAKKVSSHRRYNTSVPESLLQEISVLTGGYGAEYGGTFEQLEVFEVKNNKAKFFTNLYKSDLVYHGNDTRELENKLGENFLEYLEYEPVETEFRIEGNELLFAKYQIDSWTRNEILYYNNDTLIVKSPERNDYSVYVRRQVEIGIDYEILNASLFQSFCWGSCPRYTFTINNSGKIFLRYKGGAWGSKKRKAEEDYSYQITSEEFEEIFDIMKYLNLKKIGNKRYYVHPHDSKYKIKFTLSGTEEVEVEDYTDNGPSELRIIYVKIEKLIAKIISKK